jgi:hypothetical protein
MAALDETVKQFLKNFPQDDLQFELDRLESEIQMLRDRQRQIQDTLLLVERLSNLTQNITIDKSGGGVSKAHATGDVTVTVGKELRAVYDIKAPRKREAVLAVMRADPDPKREWRLSDLREAMISRNWLTSDEKAAHSLQVTLSNMFKSGQLARPRTGSYRLPDEEEVPAEADTP